jgi:hypothetical protein
MPNRHCEKSSTRSPHCAPSIFLDPHVPPADFQLEQTTLGGATDTPGKGDTISGPDPSRIADVSGGEPSRLARRGKYFMIVFEPNELMSSRMMISFFGKCAPGVSHWPWYASSHAGGGTA